eukprot:jgi/Mesvir1/619/Mv02050-RA.1
MLNDVVSCMYPDVSSPLMYLPTRSRYGRMINQFFAVARVVASGRIGDAVENKGECVLELHGQTVERVKPIIRDGVHVNNDLYFLLNDPEQKDKAEDEVLER